jgi:hypothetical protein
MSLMPNPLDITNSGQMPIKFGDATSGNGDSISRNNGTQGGINYEKGLSPTVLVIGGIAAVALFILLKKYA